ncbi:MAG: non-hydrolyzing UDP-N-acetylglucosamine 2-epimerase, partial [Anaerolineales bacterium]
MRVIHVAGARPNFMKLAPILRALEPYTEISSMLLHTGQHYDTRMSDVFFQDLNLPQPDINLEVGSGSHAEQTAQIMQRFEPVLQSEKPDLVLVVGDVNSTLACSLVAAKLHVTVAHVEAGVRSFDRRMPEEINRLVTDTLSDLLFTPSRYADQNLLRQGIPTEKIHFVGNVMVDSILAALSKAKERRSWSEFGLEPGGYAILTLHRASNVDDPQTLSRLMNSILQVSRLIPVIFPVHPRTANRLAESGIMEEIVSYPGMILSQPLGYLDFLGMMGDAKMILTDSGGIQAESTILGVPCLTLRDNTEWPETIQQGTNRLVGIDGQRILSAAEDILNG